MEVNKELTPERSLSGGMTRQVGDGQGGGGAYKEVPWFGRERNNHSLFTPKDRWVYLLSGKWRAEK